jgi:hypothetical protein
MHREIQISFEHPQDLDVADKNQAQKIASELISKKMTILNAVAILNCAAWFLLTTPLSSDAQKIEEIDLTQKA